MSPGGLAFSMSNFSCFSASCACVSRASLRQGFSVTTAQHRAHRTGFLQATSTVIFRSDAFGEVVGVSTMAHYPSVLLLRRIDVCLQHAWAASDPHGRMMGSPRRALARSGSAMQATGGRLPPGITRA